MYRVILITLAIMATHFVMANGTADSLSAQTDTTIMTDTIKTAKTDTTDLGNETQDNTHRFNWKQLVVPTILIGSGSIWIHNDWVEWENGEIRDELQEEIHRKITIDDYTQYAPMLAVYGLNLCGVKGRHRLLDRTIILATAYAMMGATVGVLKSEVDERRPDGSSRNSFPSGHTATAAMGAEFLYQEYKEVSPWIGAAGYVVAVGTGFLRIYNNRHWTIDVLAGGGIGMLSTKISYWVYPAVQKMIFGKKKERNIAVMPYYNGEEAGFNLCWMP